MNQLYRRAVLKLAGQPKLRGLLERRGMDWGVRRFVAGRSLPEAAEQISRLNASGLLATLDFLGESVRDREQVEQTCMMIVRMLDDIRQRGLQANISLKLSQLGLLFDESLCLGHMELIVERARSYGQFIRIDMEDSSLTVPTLSIFERLLRAYGPETVGVVIQSYLRRSPEDVDRLTGLGANLRIVKGAYREPAQIAFPDKRDVDAAYLELVRSALDRGTYTAVATHDTRIIREVICYASEHGIARDRFELQMLYGIAGSLQTQLAAEGYRVRVYTPFGEQWYPYFSRRIAERPANLWFVLKGLMRS
ncbi:proline dehydrogenase family protein [Paenibacillus filicis]|uniref:proline dehydrogenase n=1 Tax=Paenibacillus filicis TaxID=669464 RepID=A0ABU9DNE1_9BACL